MLDPTNTGLPDPNVTSINNCHITRMGRDLLSNSGTSTTYRPAPEHLAAPMSYPFSVDQGKSTSHPLPGNTDTWTSRDLATLMGATDGNCSNSAERQAACQPLSHLPVKSLDSASCNVGDMLAQYRNIHQITRSKSIGDLDIETEVTPMARRFNGPLTSQSNPSLDLEEPMGHTEFVDGQRAAKRKRLRSMQRSRRNDMNNNFLSQFTTPIRKHRSWRDENVFNRLKILARPKHRYADNVIPTSKSEISYNLVKRNSEGLIVPINRRRLNRLAEPKRYPDDSTTYNKRRQNTPSIHGYSSCCDFSSSWSSQVEKDPMCIDWSRLATPKTYKTEPPMEPYVVKKAPLKAVASRRIEKLAVPKTIVDSGDYYAWKMNKKPDIEAMLTPVHKLCINKIDLEGERVFLRCDLDWTVEWPTIEMKLGQILPTIRYCLDKNAKAVIVASHCGSPSGHSDPEFSFKPMANELSDLIGKEVLFLDDCVGPEAQALCEDPEPGSLFLLENLRFYPEELDVGTKENGDKFKCSKKDIQKFRKKLFNLADIYVQDIFNTDASNTTFGDQSVKDMAYGFNVKRELDKYNRYILNPAKPMVAVIGGEFNYMIDVLYNIIGKADEIVLGGEVAQIFLKTLKGIDIGTTPSTTAKEKKVLKAMTRAKDNGCVINLPSDLVIQDVVKQEEYFTVCTRLDVEPHYDIVDIGVTTRECYTRTIKQAASVVWLGRMGALLDGTAEIVKAIKEATASGVKSFIVEEETHQYFRTLTTKEPVDKPNEEKKRLSIREENENDAHSAKSGGGDDASQNNTSQDDQKSEHSPTRSYVKKLSFSQGVKEEASVDYIDAVSLGYITDVSDNGEMIMMLLHRKMPQNLAKLSPYRKRVKKRISEAEKLASRKRSNFDNLPGFKIPQGDNKLCVSRMNVEDKRILIVADFDVQVQDGKVVDNYALRMVIPTIKWVLKRGASRVIVVSQFARFDCKRAEDKKAASLRPVAEELELLLGFQVEFEEDFRTEPARSRIEDAHHGTVIMLENVLLNKEESYTFAMEGQKEATPRSPEAVASYCRALSSLCDIWVDEAFSLINKDRSSLTGCMHTMMSCGFLVKNELKYLARTFNAPPRKFLAIIGGVNAIPLVDQMEIARNMARNVDEMVITGALGLHCLWVEQGMRLGMAFERHIPKKDFEQLIDYIRKNNVRLYFPIDLILTEDLYSETGIKRVSTSVGIASGNYYADVGPKTISLYRRIIKRSKLLVWVGRVGACTIPLFEEGTRAVYDIVKECTENPETDLVSIVAGNTLANLCNAIDPSHKGLSHVSKGSNTVLSMLSERYLSGMDRIAFNQKAKIADLDRLSMKDFRGKRVLLRVDFREISKSPSQDELADIKEMAKCINDLFNSGATSVVVFGHLGQPLGKSDDTLSLKLIRIALEKIMRREVPFLAKGLTDAEVAMLKSPKPNSMFMLENVRFNPQELGFLVDNNCFRFNTTFDDVETYRARLSSLGDVFVNESLDALNTTDSSIVGLQNEVRLAGAQLKTELTSFKTLLPKIRPPIVCFVGGIPHQDVSSIVTHIYELIDIANDIVVCGKLAFMFLKVTKNMAIGKNEYDKTAAKLVSRVVSKAKMQNVNLHFPTDWLITTGHTTSAAVMGRPSQAAIRRDSFKAPSPSANARASATHTEDAEPDSNLTTVTQESGVPENAKCVDIGEDSIATFSELIEEANTVLYTGRIGNWENKNHAHGTKAVVEAISVATEEGDLVSIAYDCYEGIGARLKSADIGAAFSHISMANKKLFLDIVKNRPLPGLQHLNEVPKKPLTVLSVENINLKDKKVILRLDLDVPTVEGVVLDTDKMEDALPTIEYILAQEPACVIICGCRGEPMGYRNHYLSMEPLAREFEYFLGVPVTFLDIPCSRASRIACEDPAPGAVFLLENLKFYPAEYGMEDEVPDVLEEENQAWAVSANPRPQSRVSIFGERKSIKSSQSERDFQKSFNIDKLMWELMEWKTIDQFTREIGDLGEIFINDDVAHMDEELTSNLGLELYVKGCGFLMKHAILHGDADNSPTVAALSPITSDQT